MGTRYEITGFEGYRYSGNGRTSIQKRVLNNKDAIVLLIHALSEVKGYSDGSGDASGHDVRVALGMWRGLDSDKACDAKFSGYFNSGEQYGYLGTGPECDHNIVSKHNLSRRTGGYCHIATYWYRTRRGYYALTRRGQERVSALIHDRSQQMDTFNEAVDVALNPIVEDLLSGTNEDRARKWAPIDEAIKKVMSGDSGQAKSPIMAEMAKDLFGDGTVPLIDGSDEEFKVVLGRDRDARCREKTRVLVAFERGSCPSDADIVREVRRALDTDLHDALTRARLSVNKCSVGAVCVLERRSA